MTTEPSRNATPEPSVIPASTSRPRVEERSRACSVTAPPAGPQGSCAGGAPDVGAHLGDRRAPGRASVWSRSAGVSSTASTSSSRTGQEHAGARVGAQGRAASRDAGPGPSRSRRPASCPAGSARCASCTDRGRPLRRPVVVSTSIGRVGTPVIGDAARPTSGTGWGRPSPRRDRPATTRGGWRRTRSRRASTPRMGTTSRAWARAAVARQVRQRCRWAARAHDPVTASR